MFRKLVTLLFMFAFLQIPFFMSQYMHHLEGHLQELTIYRNLLINQAKIHNLSLDGYVLHFVLSPDQIIQGQGEVMSSTLKRFDLFTIALSSFREAKPWTRPFVFVRYVDGGVTSETASSFQIGFSLTLESLCYMALGFLVGVLVYNPFKRRSKKHGNV